MTNIEVLDTAIKAKYLLDSLPSILTPVYISNSMMDGINVYKGIDQLADAAGAEIFTVDSNVTDWPVKRFFEYQGVRFYQFDKEVPKCPPTD
jgi:hypothetical protein